MQISKKAKTVSNEGSGDDKGSGGFKAWRASKA